MVSALRIGLSTNPLEPQLVRNGLDGIGIYTAALKEGLPQHGCEVQGWSFPSLRGGGGLQAGRALPASYPLSLLRDALLPARRTHIPADLYHVTDYRLTRVDCPLVATLHDAITLKYPHWFAGAARSLKSRVLRKTAQYADHVITLSHAAIPELVEFLGVDEQRISVVPCGVGSHWFEAPAPDLVRRTLDQHGLRPGYFLFVGTLQMRKNVERLVEAYLRLPQHIRKERQLVIVGRAGRMADAAVARIRGAQQQAEPVVWTAYMEGEAALRCLYAAAGAFVFPSLHEGFGIPVLEAFASGVPVIASNTTSLPEVCAGAAIEIDPYSVSALADAMRAMVGDEALRARCIEAGRKRAAQLTWHNTLQKTVEVYRSVLAS